VPLVVTLLELFGQCDQRTQQGFGITVLYQMTGREGQILLADMHKRIDHTVGEEAFGEAVHYLWVHHRKLWSHQRRGKTKLFVSGGFGDHAIIIRLRTCGWNGQNRTNRRCGFDLMLAE